MVITAENTSYNTNKKYVALEDVSPMDVICGRNERPPKNRGQERYKALIRASCERYQNSETSKAEKCQIAKDIINAVIEHGGRFLKRESKTDQLLMANPSQIREKVCHALRSTRMRPKGNPAQTRKYVHRRFTVMEERAFQSLLEEQKAYLEEIGTPVKFDGLTADSNAMSTT